jgi:hypothetical protein
MSLVVVPRKQPLWVVTARFWSIAFWLLVLFHSSIGLAIKGLKIWTDDSTPSLTGGQYVFLVLWVLFMIMCGSFRGFHKQFSPMVVRRTFEGIKYEAPWHHLVFAPLFSGGFFYATKKRILRAWALLVFIISAVIITHHLPYPWRNMVDLGVVCSCGWGAISILYLSIYTTYSGKYPRGSKSDFPEATPSDVLKVASV